MSETRVQPANREVRPFGVLRESPAFHFYLLQAVGFLYLAWRFASRNYTVYGLLPDEAFGFPRAYPNELWPVPPLWITTFQFIYELVPRPSVAVVHGLQVTVVASALLGFVGVAPRWCALVVFLVASHVTGMGQASNMDVDGGTVALCLMLILALAPSRSFYVLGRRFRPLERGVDHHWPVTLLFLVVGSYYTFSGLNKLVEIGLDWPFTLHLENLAAVGIEQSLFRCDRFRMPEVAAAHLSPALSVAGGVVALVGEAGFLGILFLPRWRPFFALSMVTMHFLVYAMQGINFLGSSAVLLLCLDWNGIVRRATVLYDGDCGFCKRSVALVRRLDWFERLDFRPIGVGETGGAAASGQPDAPADSATLEREMGLVDENGEVYYGADAFEALGARCPLLWPLALALKVPGVILAARPAYRWIARHRRHLVPGATCGIDGP